MKPIYKTLTQPTETTEIITKKELARRLSFCTRKIELMVKAGQIDQIKIGAAVRFNWLAVVAALEAL